jgi:hypothetical protein
MVVFILICIVVKILVNDEHLMRPINNSLMHIQLK